MSPSVTKRVEIWHKDKPGQETGSTLHRPADRVSGRQPSRRERSTAKTRSRDRTPLDIRPACRSPPCAYDQRNYRLDQGRSPPPERQGAGGG
jgi:hypothetical protein